MLFGTISSLAIVALAGQAIAEPIRQPYKPKLAHMSPRAIFGLDRRANGGYAPEQQFCDDGNTCAEACGKGFEQCSSKDGIVHCFNKAAQQTCCPGKTGESCDKGYFCTADEKGATWCCPDSMTLEQCADAYNLPGSLVSQTSTSTTKPKSLQTSTTHASTTTTTKDASTTAKAATSTLSIPTSTTTSATTSTTSTTSTATSTSTTTSQANENSTSATPESSAPAGPETPAPPATPSPTAPVNGIATAGTDGSYGSINGIVLLGAAAFAALL
ncbi:uncharacterized protein F4812DRAFT_275612 [Daldinia caldariorum]|uniref:uncharacterized protein n=1 Tax=Daldinia caldariorum TaxID=326644 RepID=UPI002008711C|nr:uncharacterized protein F4812DRAFT_275612 [Daldinia caldariorum]KAI1470694.1 hypothetical protein F4812DRAFT_275612 [Daldinia caldariorum]